VDGILGLAFDHLNMQHVPTLIDELVLTLIQRISDFAGDPKVDPAKINRRQPSAFR
jgi:hypothetical protein